MKAKTILTLLLSWTMATGAMAENKGSLVVYLKDGSRVSFALAEEKPVVSCFRGVMTIDYRRKGESKTSSMPFGRDEVDRLEVVDVCPADVNSDGAVDVADISTVISVMASGSESSAAALTADVNGDGAVDVADISSIITEMAARARIK